MKTTLLLIILFPFITHAEGELPMPARLNPVLGAASLQFSGEGSAKPQLSGGLAVELGEDVYRATSGLLILRSDAEASFKGQADLTHITRNLLAIPLMAKVRVFNSPLQNWFFKGGLLQAFELSSNKGEVTNKMDTIMSAGVAAQVALFAKADLTVETSYNRGLIPALKAAHSDVYSEGWLLLVGMAFGI